MGDKHTPGLTLSPHGDAGWSSPVARQAHNLKVAGSNPAPATKSSTTHPTQPRKHKLAGPTALPHAPWAAEPCDKNYRPRAYQAIAAFAATAAWNTAGS